MKKLFQNYNFEFDKNDKKFLNVLIKQILKQLNNSTEHQQMRRIFEGISEKINGPDDVVKLTKNEKAILKEQLENNLALYKKESKKSWFFKRWLYKSMITQYSNMLGTHFKG